MIINDLFNKMFGGDFLPCVYSKEHGTIVADEVMSSVLDYSHEHWEAQYVQKMTNHVETSPQLDEFALQDVTETS